jgi:hypothetical protein
MDLSLISQQTAKGSNIPLWPCEKGPRYSEYSLSRSASTGFNEDEKAEDCTAN